ncbi:acetyltransferase [Sporosarcina sp. E16_3]|uniref:acetyltransferase n=1 Tax=Sporosarcina sp. E16_3 TaxID=2789293 RepID=UPI001A912C93|nr:acetyltransferase [Sporosarcina sp. E16_3]MBO0602537.1 acetyltransferase [Sporosarcina sp. E16_3]
MKKVVIIGDGGHGKVVADIVNSNSDMIVYAILDDKHVEAFIENGILNGPISHVTKLIDSNQDIRVVFGIGSNAARKKIFAELEISPDKYIRAIHSSAIVSPSAKIGNGAVVMPGVIINVDAIIEEHVIVNSGCVVEHDCVVSKFSHISPLAVLTGGVRIGEGTHIGAGASVIPLKTIGAWTVVGAGAVVVSDIEDRVTVVGSPARVIKREG